MSLRYQTVERDICIDQLADDEAALREQVRSYRSVLSVALELLHTSQRDLRNLKLANADLREQLRALVGVSGALTRDRQRAA
jgi:hypothetical protein